MERWFEISLNPIRHGNVRIYTKSVVNTSTKWKRSTQEKLHWVEYNVTSSDTHALLQVQVKQTSHATISTIHISCLLTTELVQQVYHN